VQWLPAVGPSGENLVRPPTQPELAEWWRGPTLAQVWGGPLLVAWLPIVVTHETSAKTFLFRVMLPAGA
jgi:hypothetical protein